METKFSKEVPVKLGKARNGFMLAYDVKETPMEEIERQWRLGRGTAGEGAGEPDEYFIRDHRYMYNEIRIPQGQMNYGGIVNAIVRDKYGVEEMESITNNVTSVVSEFFNTLVTGGIVEATKLLKESFKGSNTELFMEMQQWRALAKKEAKNALNMQ